MDQGKKVTFPHDLLAVYDIEGTIFNAMSKDYGIALLSEIKQFDHILTIHQLLYSGYSESFEFAQELATFSFESREELVNFAKRLPEISALEMLMLLKPLHQTEGTLN